MVIHGRFEMFSHAVKSKKPCRLSIQSVLRGMLRLVIAQMQDGLMQPRYVQWDICHHPVLNDHHTASLHCTPSKQASHFC